MLQRINRVSLSLITPGCRHLAKVVASTGNHKRAQGSESRLRIIIFKKRVMEPNPQGPVAALVKVLEDWVTGQKR